MSSANQTLPAALFSSSEQEQVRQLLQNFSNQQLQWLAGYLTGLQHSNQQLLNLINRIPVAQEGISNEPIVQKESITVLYGSKSGNGKAVAKNLHDKLIARGYTATLQNMGQYQPSKLKDEKWLLVVVSTHGEGDPPPTAEDLHAFIHTRKAPKLSETRYAVLALGDKSYASFCQTGKDFDKRLGELGGQKVLERVDADVDFEETAEQWIESVIAKVQQEFGASTGQAQPLREQSSNGSVKTAAPAVKYNRKNPFEATVLEKVQLNGRGSAKQTFHIELSLEGSGLSYQPGDTLGLIVENDTSLVQTIIEKMGWDGNLLLNRKEELVSLQDFLTKQAELTTISGVFLQQYASYVNDPALAHSLQNTLQDKTALGEFVYGKDVLDILIAYPSSISPAQFADAVLPLQARLYSIASSITAHPDEVHITVGKVQYTNNNRLHKGVASNHIADKLEIGSNVKVFIEKNESFRLPENAESPIIMIGPGTGIAPFRAFVEERAETGVNGKSWLFFGDQHFTTDFLYQLEWQRFLKQGSLTKMNTAFSRDTDKKIYVQTRMKQHASELFQWLEEGATIYVCGDAKRMAKDVRQTWIDIVQQEGNRNVEEAAEYIKQLIKSGRYQEDVY
ncbi:assimilatory sulfite reductase (NADPH) flavoprotein subunit [Flavihumibacter rivuli]|uniref:assimilatory sulfite reductase (NADPH) flavoprotein subunit n=1 Tax=Flavihumibacter rivuli TaxID=2838156 RepID=UPI001BDF3EB1|nr:assimilatory sulfite reductase (NADPH) flavoprotein subunit [Flavihumibacter rivuli]ULQ57459.1 assimilatory sulfite reductase (NADPH) flavoprotein subunit [Flavihumibacter rivuli]